MEECSNHRTLQYLLQATTRARVRSEDLRQGTVVRLDPGSFNIAENLNFDYITTYLGCSGAITDSQTLTCTIINDDKPRITTQKLTQTGNVRVTKNVINDDGGTRQASDFVISVTGNNPSPSVFFGTASPGANDVRLAPGSYRVTETSDSRYDTSYSAGCTGIISTGETKIMHNHQQ